MLRDRGTLLSVVSACVLASLVLFVFWAFQNYGPDSALRRLHVAVSRINRYLPADQPIAPSLLQREDAADVSNLCVGGLRPVTQQMIDALIRPKLLAGARYTIYRTQYEAPDKATTVMLYELQGQKLADVYVLTKEERGPWRVNPEQTARLWSDLRRPRGPF